MPSGSGFWIIRPLNAPFLILLAAFLALLAVSSLALRGKSERTRRTVLIAACAVTAVGYFVYKYLLSLDEAYDAITAGVGGFNWWGELPLQLCNVNMILIPIAVLKRNRPLMCFSFFIGPLGALMALLIPGNGFEGYSLLLPRMLGYYGTHLMLVIEGWALVTFGLFKPHFSDLPKAVLALVILAFSVFCVDMLLRWTGLYSRANYFFAVETEGNALLDIFWKWIPLPFLYLIPCIGILAGYMALVMLGFTLARRLRRKETA